MNMQAFKESEIKLLTEDDLDNVTAGAPNLISASMTIGNTKIVVFATSSQHGMGFVWTP